MKLPNGRVVAIDAKTNVDAYLDALDADDEEELETQLDRYAATVSPGAEARRKSYWTSSTRRPSSWSCSSPATSSSTPPWSAARS